MATLSTTPPPLNPPTLKPDILPNIDMTTLTQSELYSLSLLSPSSFDLRCTHDLVIPTIDRSLFNESSGSRRQTYSRPSPTHSHHHHHRHRIAGLLPSSSAHHHHHHHYHYHPPTTTTTTENNPDRLENHSIINFLKQILPQNPNFSDIEFTPTPQPQLQPQPSFFFPPAPGNLGTIPEQIVKKRKRGRKPKLKPGFEEERGNGLEIVNKNGVVVNVLDLATLNDPYGDEIKRRTEGLGSEEELLAFLTDLGGQWCSRRRKRKIVDACVIGDMLPVGWKLLLGLKRREGRASVYVRRYISPGGKQFVSCKEVSAYLQSFFGLLDANQRMDHGGDNIQQDYSVASESPAGVMHKQDDQRQSNETEKENTLLGDNLEEVQIHDLFECHKCNMTFDEKDTYLQHLLSFHQRTTRRYRLGSSVGDGVIIKDGKYECQFCHKVFHERRRYNGHVGIHVRNYVRGIEESPGRLTLPRRFESPSRDELPARISKMDALIEIAQNSIMETSAAGPNDEPDGGLTADKLTVVSKPGIPASISDHELNSESSLSEPEMEDGMIDRKPNEELYQQNSVITDEKMEKIDDASNILHVKMDSLLDTSGLDTVNALSANVQNADTSEIFGGKDDLSFTGDETDKFGNEQERCLESHSLTQKIYGVEHNMNLACNNTAEHPKPNEGINKENVEVHIGFGSDNGGPANDIVTDAAQQIPEENLLEGGVSGSIEFTTFNEISEKGEGEFCSIDQRHDNVTGFEELRLDEIEHLKFNFGNGQESLSLQEVTMDLAKNVEMEGTYGSSVQFESEEVMLDVAGGHQLTTVCVWCGIEFSHEAVDSEIQSDSVGYMCPACKAKISGQINALASGHG